MMRFILGVLATALLTQNAMACRATPEMQRRQDRADVIEQKSLVRHLAESSDAIYVAKAVAVNDDANTATFQVIRTLKGNAPVSALLNLELRDEITLGCTRSAAFTNTFATVGQKYVVYVSAGKVTRTGSTKRSYPEISFREEIKQLAEVLVPNKTMEPTW